MTSCLMCDSCGRLATDRDDTGGADNWYELNRNPAIIGPGLISAAHGMVLSSIEDGDLDVDLGDADEDDYVDIEVEAPLHFCSAVCLRDWADKNAENP